MKKQIPFLFLIISLFTSCVSYKYKRFEASSKALKEKLPPLDLEIDKSSIYIMFNRYKDYLNRPYYIGSDRYSRSRTKARAVWFSYLPKRGSLYYSKSIDNYKFDNTSKYIFEIIENDTTDLRSKDQIEYLNFVTYNNICESNSEVKGKIKYEVESSKLTNGIGLIFNTISVSTLCAINLTGFPVGKQRVKMSLRCTITDNNSNEIYSKTVRVKGSSYSAAFWGYSGNGCANRSFQGDVQRSANMKAISKALSLITNDIEANRNKIVSGLR